MNIQTFTAAVALAILPATAIQAAPKQSTPPAAKVAPAGQSIAQWRITYEHCFRKHVNYCVAKKGWSSMNICRRWAARQCSSVRG